MRSGPETDVLFRGGHTVSLGGFFQLIVAETPLLTLKLLAFSLCPMQSVRMTEIISSGNVQKSPFPPKMKLGGNVTCADTAVNFFGVETSSFVARWHQMTVQRPEIEFRQCGWLIISLLQCPP